MSFTFVFDTEAYDRNINDNLDTTNDTQTLFSSPSSIAEKYFAPQITLPPVGPGRIRREDVVYGSTRLKQILAAAAQRASFIHVFEQPHPSQKNNVTPMVYEPWLGVCYKVTFACSWPTQNGFLWKEPMLPCWTLTLEHIPM